jgi:hypothetical protein
MKVSFQGLTLLETQEYDCGENMSVANIVVNIRLAETSTISFSH